VRERVEQEVRLDLRLEHLQPRLGGLLVHSRRIQRHLLERRRLLGLGADVKPCARDEHPEPRIASQCRQEIE
jgi:hypothetical protein